MMSHALAPALSDTRSSHDSPSTTSLHTAAPATLNGTFSVGPPGRPPLPSALCCLLEGDVRCNRQASVHVFSKRLHKFQEEKGANLRSDPMAGHNNICSQHRRLLVGQPAKTRSERNSNRQANGQRIAGGGDMGGRLGKAGQGGGNSDSDSDHESAAGRSQSLVKLHALSASALRRYKKFFKLPRPTNGGKQQLLDIVAEHFQTLPVNEREILAYFIYTVKTGSNRLDQQRKENANC